MLSDKADITMQKQFLLFGASVALLSVTLFSGCDSKKKGAEITALAQTSTQLPQQSGIKPQPASAPAPDLASMAIGEKVFKSTCGICHKSGLNGAPRMGNREDWEARLAQSKEVLYGRAINGYRGSKGPMPSRGSNTSLSEAEVKAAVDYMVAHSTPGWSAE